MFVWDDDKSRKNKTKHGIAFDAVSDFDWETTVRVDRSHLDRDGETRIATIGWMYDKLYTVILTYRDGDIRIISMRRSNKAEEKLYAEKTI